MRSPFPLEISSLFLLDALANVIDFAFHFWMGRVLIPSDFAVLQTLNSIALVYITAAGVFQPVVGRFVAEARGRGDENSIPAIVQTFLRSATFLGAVFAILCFSFSSALSHAFNLPPWTIQLSSAILFLSTLRPVAAGTLQGQERFLAFGIARLALSLGRILFILLIYPTGIGLMVTIVALPFGMLVSVLCAFLLLGTRWWRKSEAPPQNILSEGWRLSAYALLAHVAYMTLTSLDLVWVNRNLGGEAGAYASLVLMRRIIALLPGVAVTIMFPRMVKILAQGQQPHRLLLQTTSIILATGGALTVLYFVFSESLIQLIFKNNYQAAAPLLGWMGLAMVGVSLSSIWLNYYLADHPRNFVILLIAAIALEWILLYRFPSSLQYAVLAFGLTGWSLSLIGLILYSRRPLRALPGQ